MQNITSFSAKKRIANWLTLTMLLCSLTTVFGYPVPDYESKFIHTNKQVSYVASNNITFHSESVASMTNDTWLFECGEDKRVDEYGFNANCNETTTATIPNSGSVYQYAVEIVYKGGNPGSSIQVKDSNNVNHTLQRSVPFGSSSNIWVYRKIIQGNTSSITYTNGNNKCNLQSVVIYAFRNAPGSPGSSGVFTNRSGYNDIQTINISIPSFPVARDLVIESPISEMTTDGRYLLLKAEAGGVTDQIFVYGPDASLPQASCCLTIPSLILRNVPGNITQVTLTVDTRNGQNGQSVNGQSWVIAAGVNVDALCGNDPDIALIKTGTFNDLNGNGSAEAGETVSYNFTVTNTGQTPLSDITITDPLVSVSGSLASLNPGQSNNTAFTATYTLTPTDILNGFVENQAEVEGCYQYEPVDPNGNCDGKVNYLELEYLGNVFNAQIKVIEHDGQIVFNNVVQPGERFEFVGQDPPQNTFGPKIDIYINNNLVQEIHTSCSQPIGIGSIFGDFEVINGSSRNGGPLAPVTGSGCVGVADDLSDDNSNDQDDPTVVPLPGPPPATRDCNCSPLYKDSDFNNPALVSGSNLQVGAVYRFSNVFPGNPHGTTIDALVKIVEFTGGASLLNIDVTSSGLPEAFQPRINSTNNLNQSVLFDITFVTSGGNYGDEVDISFYATPLDIDGDGSTTREYAEVTLPDAYFVSNNTVLNLAQTATVVRGTANSVITAPGGDVSLDPRFTFSTYYETKSSVQYRIGKIDGNDDRYYSLNMSCAEYTNPNSVIVTYPVICGNVSDDNGNPLQNVEIDVTGNDGSAQTVFTDANGNYKAIAQIPEALVDVTYEIRENDPAGYISISDVDGANDNLITRTIDLESTCGNDFVDGIEVVLTLQSKTDILCNGDTTGSITVTASGGIPPYTYTLNGGTPQSSPTFNNLAAGVYTIGVSDSLGNTDSISVTLTQPEPISIQITKMNATATGGCVNGQATANPSGGVPPYTYQWSASAGNQTTATATNLPAGTHTVVVTDANNCTLQQGVVIDCVPNCDAVITVDEVINVLCTNEMTGSATVSASSAMNPGATFTFTWNTVPPQIDAGVSTSTVSNLAAGVYTVSVTIDGTLCQPVQQSVTITQPSTALNVTATSTDETGPTTGDGTATANPTGGTPPYTYSWSPGGATTQTITGLSAGTYTVTVTDANGCTAMASTTVNPGSCRDLAANASSTPVSCNGGSDGTATVGVTGGLGPFTYSWSPGGQTTQTITGLTAGVYTVTVTDQSTLCTATSTTTVNQPSPLSSGIAVTNVACFGDDTGSLDLTVTGGTPPYSFVWSPNGETTEDLFDLTAGSYSVVITDANGCTKTDSAMVMQPSEALSINITSQTDILCSAPSAVTVAASGGTPPYLYALDGGTPQASGTFNDLTEGNHTISVVDANGCDASVAVTILKNCTVAVDDINDTFVNTPVDGNVLTNDFDLEGDTQTVTTTTVTTVRGVTVIIDLVTGAYTYTPPTDFIGEDSFEYTICDDGNPQACDSATVYIEVQPMDGSDNDPPVANADTNTTQKNVPVDGNVLPNDYDPDGDPITITTPSVTTAQGVTVNINPDGSYTYNPPLDYLGEDTFEYTICDNGTPALCDTAVVTIQVLDTTDNITTAVDDAYFTQIGVPISANVLDNDTDPEGDNQTVDIAISPSSGPSNGTVILNADGSFVYTPNAAYFGPDSFVYSIFDNGSPVATDSATVTILISPFVNTTVAVDDINDTFVNIPVSGNVLTNDFDLEGDTQTVTTTTVTTAQGVIVTIDPTSGAYTYIPPTDYIGEDSFEYTICDDGNPQACDSAVVYIEIQPIDGPNNDPPVANADTNTTQKNVPVDGNVLPNDYDPDGDPITVTANTDPSNGTVVINPDGTYTYTPNTDFVGEDTFTYTICDNGTPALCDTATVTIQVLDTTDNITTAVDDSYYTTVGIAINANVLDNDTDPEGDNQTVDIAISPSSGPSNGTVILNADGSFVYTPNPGYNGPDSFVYSIFDDGTPVATDSATVTILVGFIGNDILAVDDINNTYVDLPVSGSVATNDENPDGPAGTEVFTLVSGPSNGSLVFNPDGSYTYTPDAGYEGEDTFEYQVCDGGNPIACDTATVYIEVLPVGSPDNEPPVANADTNTTEVDTPVSGNVLVNDFDPDGDPITVTANTDPSNGTVVVNPDGSYTYTPNPGFEGEDTFTYTICDNGTPALCDTATVTILVIPNNGNITVANDDAYNGFIGQPISGNVLDND
ncbi:MAG: hypothetical protein CL605_05075, partial [Altibacter sp.]|uniref:Ig-like domain-containing protein n=2 Tax=Altibacter TaxID=1535231 RepID=UPI000C8C75E0